MQFLGTDWEGFLPKELPGIRQSGGSRQEGARPRVLSPLRSHLSSPCFLLYESHDTWRGNEHSTG